MSIWMSEQNTGGPGDGDDNYVPPAVTSETTISLTTTATVNDGTFTVFASQACTELELENDTGASIEYQRNGTGEVVVIEPGLSRRIVGITNANQIGVRRVDWSTGKVSRPTVVTAKALTTTEAFVFAGAVSVNIVSGGGNTQAGALACTGAEIINATGKIVMWRIGTTAAYRKLRHGESVPIRGITNINQLYFKPYDSVASFLRPITIEAFTSGFSVPLSSNRQARMIAPDARIPMDDVNYPGQWGTPAWLSVSEQNETRRTLRKKGAVALALFPSIATCTLSSNTPCADVATGELLFGTTALEYTQAANFETMTFAGLSALPIGLNVAKSDIHFDYSFPDNNGINYGINSNINLFEIELHSAGSPSAPTANCHKVIIPQSGTNFVRVDVHGTHPIISNSVPISKFAAVGTGANLSAVTWARIRLQGGGSTAVGSKFRPHGIWAVPKARTKAAVVFVFDDLHISQYTNALPILAKYNYPACVGLDTTTKAGQTNFMTPVQIRNLHQRHGWQILGQVQGGNGASTNTDTRISEEQAITQAGRYKTAMKMLGISDTQDFSRGSTSFNSDGGSFYPNWFTLRRLFRTNVEFLGGSNTTPPMNLGETVPFGDHYSIKRLNMSGFTAGTYAQRWQEHVDQAVTDSGVAIFGAHSEFNTGLEGLTALATLVEYIRVLELQGKVEVLTIAELIESAYETGKSNSSTDNSVKVIPVLTTRTVSNEDVGAVLEMSNAANVTVPSGLNSGFNFIVSLPETGSVTITPGSGVTINGSNAVITKSATNLTLALIPTSTPNSYKLTGV